MRIFPKNRGRRIVMKLAIVLGYAAILWYWVFPWLDRTYINRPAL